MLYADNHCKVEENYSPHTYTFTGVDVFSGKTISVKVPAEEIFRYRQGELIQDALKSLNDDEREFLMTGIYDSWDDIFPED